MTNPLLNVHRVQDRPVKVVGLISRKEYVRGTEAYCFRYLKDKYPSELKEDSNNALHCYPEPLQILDYKPRKGKKNGSKIQGIATN